MPYIPVDPNEPEWRTGLSIIGKVAKPGSKTMVHGNGRQSLNFTVIVPTGIPFGMKTGANDYDICYFRCRMMDPEFVLYPSDVVEATGVLIKVGTDLSLLVNKLRVIARFHKKVKAPVTVSA